MPSPRQEHGVAAVDGQVVVVAGVDDVLWVPGGAPDDGFGAYDVNQGYLE